MNRVTKKIFSLFLVFALILSLVGSLMASLFFASLKLYDALTTVLTPGISLGIFLLVNFITCAVLLLLIRELFFDADSKEEETESFENISFGSLAKTLAVSLIKAYLNKK